jgi:hypothetical protein
MKNAGDLASEALNWIKSALRKSSAWLAKTWKNLFSKPETVKDQEEMENDLLPVGIRSGQKTLAKPRRKPIRRRSRERVYRLKGYTTVTKVNRKRQSERQQRILRRILVGIVIILLLILLFNLYNPIKNLSEWYRIIGIDDLADLTKAKPLTTETTKNTGSATTSRTTTTASGSTTATANKTTS